VRWGIPDAFWAYLAGIVGVLVCTVPFPEADRKAETAAFLAAATLGQDGGIVLAIAAIARRKGTGSLVSDFGLRLWVGDLWIVPAGMGLAAVLSAAVAPLSHLSGGQEQQVVSDLKDASGAKLVVLVLLAGLAAPVVEELLFRGLLLRALLRRMPAVGAVAVSGVAFGLVHFIGGEALGTAVALPALVTLGVISAAVAVRTGDLSRSILLHAGFNLLTILSVVI
jgi:membrane protease YdiL (CAAX protease family)